MTYAVTSSSLSSFSTGSTSSSSSLNASSVSSPIEMTETWKQIQKDPVGIIASFHPKRAQILGNVKKFKGLLKTEYSKTLEIFKTRIGAQNYSGISATAVSDLKRVISKEAFPNAFEKISENKTLLTKRIFCNLFKKIKLMDGDDFLRSLFPDEDILSASNVIDYSINPDVLEKMHQWVEDKNLITMMMSIAEQRTEISRDLQAQNLLVDIGSASLDAVHAKAQSFRAWISGNNNLLLNVTELYLDNLGLTSLPSEIDKFINLQRLDLTHNRLTLLPDSIGNLGNLQGLYLTHNRLTLLPDSIGNLGNLSSFLLGHNQLTQLPNAFGNLRNLQRLWLYYNELTHLPNSFGNLGNLQVLGLSNNHLTQLPNNFGNLGNLQSLSLSNNHLTQLPDMTNLSENIRKEILKNSSLKAQVSYYLAPYLPKKEAVIATVALVAFAYLTYTYSND
jgi:hypothetical protein